VSFLGGFGGVSVVPAVFGVVTFPVNVGGKRVGRRLESGGELDQRRLAERGPEEADASAAATGRL